MSFPPILNRHPLITSHLQLAHLQWEKLLNAEDWVIDATCGRGQDTVFIAKCLQEKGGAGGIIAMDIQSQAINETEQRLQSHLSPQERQPIYLIQESHEQFPEIAYSHPIALIVYNLGYLPSGDKHITTQTASTLSSLQKAIQLAQTTCVTCYRGHSEGRREEQAILQWIQTLDPQWQIDYYQKEGSLTAPSLFLMAKAKIH